MTYVSPYLAAAYDRHYQPHATTFIVPNGLPQESFALAPKKTSRNLPPTYVVVSAADRHKNVRTALLAFGRVAHKLADSRLILIGRGLHPGSDLHRKAVRLGIADRTEFRGSLMHADILETLRNEADVFLSTSREESFCMAVVEAMANGLPVIAGYDTGGPPWLVDHGRAGMLVDCDDEESVAQAMLVLARDPARADALAQAAWNRAQNMFALESVAQQYVNIYRQVVEP
jgi:glycosyltransferase involved in cell wall biosynthesis